VFTLSVCGQIVVTETDKFQANTVTPAVALRSASGWLFWKPMRSEEHTSEP